MYYSKFGVIVIEMRGPLSLTPVSGVLFKWRRLKVIVFGRRGREWVLPSCSGHRNVFHGSFSSRARYRVEELESGAASSHSAVSVACCGDMVGSRVES